MFSWYSKNLYKRLIQSNFTPVFFMKNPQDGSGEEIMVTLMKVQKGVVNFVQLINLDKIGDEFLKRGSHEFTKKFAKGLNVGENIKILNIFISDTNKKEVIDNLDKSKYQDEICWLVYPENNTLKFYCPPQQPKKFMNIRYLIKKAYSDSKDSENLTFQEIIMSLLVNNPLPVKTNTAYGSFILILLSVYGFLMNKTLFGISRGSLSSFSLIQKDLLFNNNEFFLLISNMFLYYNIYQFMVNILLIILFCRLAEQFLGRFDFLCIYFICGIVSNFITIQVTHIFPIGNTGAIFGIFGVLLTLSLLSKKYFILKLLLPSLLVLVTYVLAMHYFPLTSYVTYVSGFVSGVILGTIYFFANKPKSKKTYLPKVQNV